MIWIKLVSTMAYYSSLFFHKFECCYFSCEIDFTVEKCVLPYFLNNLNSTMPYIMIFMYHVKQSETGDWRIFFHWTVYEIRDWNICAAVSVKNALHANSWKSYLAVLWHPFSQTHALSAHCLQRTDRSQHLPVLHL